MASDPNQKPRTDYEEIDDTLEDTLYARHAEIQSFEDLEKQRGTSIPALFNQLYKFVQNPSSVSVETYKRMVDTDDTIGSGVDFLTTCLAARMGRYVHPSAEITAFVNKALDNVDGGWVNAIKEIFSATWAGFSASETVWANTEEGFVPKRIVTLPPTTVLFETERTGELTPDGILQYQRNYNPFIQGNGLGSLTNGFAIGAASLGFSGSRPDAFAKFGDFPFPFRTANSFNYLCIRIPAQKCIHYPFNAQGQFGNPYGRSLLRRIYKYYVIKDAVLQMMTIALDRKGTPLTIIYADPNTMTEGGDQNASTNAEDFRNNKFKGMRADEAAAKLFKNIHNDSSIVLPGKKGEIYDTDFLPQASNVGDFIQALEFCNKSTLRGLLIPSLIFGSGDGSGSYSLGQEHKTTFDAILDSTNAGAEHILIQQLIRQIIAFNFPRSAWEKEGCGSFSKRTLSREEISKEMEMFEKAIDKGIVDASDLEDLNKMRDTIGFEPRTEPIPQKTPFDLIPSAEPGQEPKDPEEAKESKFKAKLLTLVQSLFGKKKENAKIDPDPGPA